MELKHVIPNIEKTFRDLEYAGKGDHISYIGMLSHNKLKR